jgi:hypothetical protein
LIQHSVPDGMLPKSLTATKVEKIVTLKTTADAKGIRKKRMTNAAHRNPS